MAAELLDASPTFRASIAACAAALQRYGVDLLAEFGRADGWSTPALAMAGLSAVQARATRQHTRMLGSTCGPDPDNSVFSCARQRSCTWPLF